MKVKKTTALEPEKQMSALAAYLADPVNPDEFIDEYLAKIDKKPAVIEKINISQKYAKDAMECIVETKEEKIDAERMLGVLGTHSKSIIEETESARAFFDKIKKATLRKREEQTAHLVTADKKLREIVEDFSAAELERIEEENRKAMEENERLRLQREAVLRKQADNAKKKGKEEKVLEKLAQIEDLEETYIPDIQIEPKTRNEINIFNPALFFAQIRSIQQAAFIITDEEREMLSERGYGKQNIQKFENMLLLLKDNRKPVEVPLSCFKKDERNFNQAVQNMDNGLYPWGSVKKVPVSARARSK